MELRKKIAFTSDLILIAAFLCIIWLPLADNVWNLDPSPAQQEKRNLASMPEMPDSLAACETFPPVFEAFYNDHFGFRSACIFLHGYIQVMWLRNSDSDRVIVGKEPWLFYEGRKVIEYHRGIDLFTQKELDAWRRTFEERRDWLRDRGIEYAVFFATNKHTVYPEYLPNYIRRAGNTTRLDQLMAYMTEHSDVNIIDTRPALLEAKRYDRLFHWTGSHWNDRGGYAAYRVVMQRLAELFPPLAPKNLNEFDLIDVKTRGGDLALMLGLDSVLHEVQLNMRHKKPQPVRKVFKGVMESATTKKSKFVKPFALVQKRRDLPKALFFRDSFFSNLVRFFAPHFSRSIYYWQYDFDCDVIEFEKPDIVVNEFLERELMNITPENPPELTPAGR